MTLCQIDNHGSIQVAQRNAGVGRDFSQRTGTRNGETLSIQIIAFALFAAQS